MTLESAAIILAIPLGIFSLIFGYREYAKFDLQRLSAYDEWATRFFAGSTHLLANPDLPEAWVTIISDLNAMLTNNDAARAMYKVFWARRKRKLPSEPSFSDEELRVMKADPSAGPEFLRMMVAGLLAISYTSHFWGIKARALLAERLGRNEKAPTTSDDVREITQVANHRLAAA